MKNQFTNKQASQLMEELAAVLEVLGENHFKIRAYKNAAETISSLEEPLYTIWQRGELEKIKGIGKAIAEKLGDIFATGRSEEVETIKAQVPKAMFSLLPVEGIGPKKAYKLTKEFGLENPETVIDDLKTLIKADKISQLDGFGAKSQADILNGINRYNPDKEVRMRIDQADAIANDVLDYLKKSKVVSKISALGSLRRRKSTIGDVDLGVATDKPEEFIKYLEAYPQINQIIANGDQLVRFVHKTGVNVDVKILDPKMWGSLLQHFTGSKQHNVALREYALKKGMSLSEHGIKILEKDLRNKEPQYHSVRGTQETPLRQGFEGQASNKIKNEVVTFDDEVAFYNYLGLNWIPPEVRENTGEIQQAEKQKIDNLITTKNIKGDFHTHTNYDWPTSHDYGVNTPEEVVSQAISLGYEYVGVGDHNPRRSVDNPNTNTILVRERVQNINKIGDKYKSVIKVFNVLEVDILPDGQLALEPEALEELDFVLVSVHSSLNQPQEVMTQRILTALKQSKVKVLAHPTGRLINKREGYEVDWKPIFEICQQRNIALEINANPQRLDLSETVIRQAITQGIKLIINTDAHAVAQMKYMSYGISEARRGFAKAKDVVNTYSLKDFQAWLNT